MRSALTLLLMVVVAAGGGCQKPPDKPAPTPASRSTEPVRDANVKGLEGAVSNALEPLKPGDCRPGTGEHQMAGVKRPPVTGRPKPCEPTPQLYARDAARAKALAAAAERAKHPQP